MTAAESSCARPDRSSFFTLEKSPEAQNRWTVLEVDACRNGSPAILASISLQTALPVALAVSTTSTGETWLGVLSEDGDLSIWDIGTTYTLSKTFHLPACRRPTKTTEHISLSPLVASANLPTSVYFMAAAGSASVAPTIHAVCLGEPGRYVEQRLDLLDPSRKRIPIAAIECHPHKAALCVAFMDGIIYVYDTTQAHEIGSPEERAPESETLSTDISDEGGAQAEPSEPTEAKTIPVALATEHQLPLRLRLCVLCKPTAKGSKLTCVSFGQDMDLIAAGCSGGEIIICALTQPEIQLEVQGPCLHYIREPLLRTRLLDAVLDVQFVPATGLLLIMSLRRPSSHAGGSPDGVGTKRIRVISTEQDSIGLSALPSFLQPSTVLLRGKELLCAALPSMHCDALTLLWRRRTPGAEGELVLAPLVELLHCPSLPVLDLPLACLNAAGESSNDPQIQLGWPPAAEYLLANIEIKPVMCRKKAAPGQSLIESLVVCLKSSLRLQSLNHLERHGIAPSMRLRWPIPSSTADLRKLAAESGIDDAVLSAHLQILRQSQSLHAEWQGFSSFVPHRLSVAPDALSIILLLGSVDTVAVSDSLGRTSQPQEVEQFMYLLLGLDLSRKDRQSFALQQLGIAADAVFVSSGRLLILSGCGKRIEVHSRSQSSSATVVSWSRTSEREFCMTCKRIFSIPIHALEHQSLVLCVLVLSRTDHLPLQSNRACSSESLERREILVLNRQNFKDLQPPDPCSQQNPVHLLQESEKVIDAQARKDHGRWAGDSRCLSVLTTHRILLYDDKLSNLSTILRVGPGCCRMSLGWLGHVPVFVDADGKLRYLLPGSLAESEKAPLLCSLREQHVGKGVRLIGPLQDRLLYAVREGPRRQTKILTRPLQTLEPLLLTAIRPAGLLTGSRPTPYVEVMTIIDLLAPRPSKVQSAEVCPPDASHTTEEGTGQSAGLTAMIYFAIYLAGLLHHAGSLLESVSPQSQEAFHRRPWIGSAMKAGVAATLTEWRKATLELVSHDVCLLESVLVPDSIKSTSAYSPHGKLGRAITSLARECEMFGRWPEALRLHDLAGCDGMACGMLARHAAREGRVKPASGFMMELNSGIAHPFVIAFTHHITGSRSREHHHEAAADLLESSLIARLPPWADGRTRPGLLPSSTVDGDLPHWNAPKCSIAHAKTTSSDDDFLLARLRIPDLVLDRVEEWLGRASPGMLTLEGRDEPSQAPLATPGWVSGVGLGRNEEANLILYYRFGELDAVSEGSSLGRQRFNGDLTQYGGAIDVVEDLQGAVMFETSTSPVDQGELGKVKSLSDVVWSMQPCMAGIDGILGRGLEVQVLRGSALDVGPYQVEEGRTKLTVELWVCRPQAAAVRPEVLLTRVAEGPGPPTLWRLALLSNGCLVLTSDAEMRRHEIRSNNDAIGAGKWSHVAFILESSGKDGCQATARLFIAGLEVSRGRLDFPPIGEELLKRTTIQIGPQLEGHRMTELRMWALSRTPEEIYDNRENYLQLAEKRKRLAIKLKVPNQSTGKVAGLSLLSEADNLPAAHSSLLGPQSGPLQDAEKAEFIHRDGRRRKGSATGQTEGVRSTPDTISSDAARQGPLLIAAASLSGSLQPPRARSNRRRPSAVGLSAPSEGSQCATKYTNGLLGAAERQHLFPSKKDAHLSSLRISSTICQADEAPSSSRQQPQLGEYHGDTIVSGRRSVTGSMSQPSDRSTPWAMPAGVLADRNAADDPNSQTNIALREETKASSELGLGSFSISTPTFKTSIPCLPQVSLIDLYTYGVDPQLLASDTPAQVMVSGGRYVCLVEKSRGAKHGAVLVIAMSFNSPSTTQFRRYSFLANTAILSKTGQWLACHVIRSEERSELQVYDLMARTGITRRMMQDKLEYWAWLWEDIITIVTPSAVFSWAVLSGKLYKLFDLLWPPKLDRTSVISYGETDDRQWAIVTREGAHGAIVQIHNFRCNTNHMELQPGIVVAALGRCLLTESESTALVLIVLIADEQQRDLQLYVYTESEDPVPDTTALSSQWPQLLRLRLSNSQSRPLRARLLFEQDGRRVFVLLSQGNLFIVDINRGRSQERGTICSNDGHEGLIVEGAVHDACLNSQGNVVSLDLSRGHLRETDTSSLSSG